MKKLIFILIAMLQPLLASADANGTCGENLTWSYVESTNTLTISGTGEMGAVQFFRGCSPVTTAEYSTQTIHIS